MHAMISGLKEDELVTQRTAALFGQELEANYKRTDRMFAWLMVIQWVAGVGAALWISPQAWVGQYSHTHIHVWAALFLGGMISGFPVFLAVRYPGSVLTRHVIAVGQMLSCGLLIHLSGGRIEAHFQYFGALAFLAFYRDWRVLFIATVVAAADHFFRGLFWPRSIFGVLGTDWWRWLEHAGWIFFEDTILVLAIRQNLRQMLGVADRQAKLETVKETVERKVDERTGELRKEIEERQRAEEKLRSSEARKNAIVQSSLDCIVAINHEGKILEFNPAAEKMFGFARAEVLERELAQVIIPPSLRERHRQGMMHYLATGEERVIGKRIEITALRSDGSEFPVELAITRMGAETPPTFTGFIRDISERKRAEWQLNIQYAISRVLAESSTLKQASARILQTVCENLNWEVGAFWQVDRRAGVMQFYDAWIAPNFCADDFITLNRQVTFTPGVGLPGRVWETGRPVWVSDVVVDANFPRIDAAKKVGLHGAFSAPILAGNEVVGVIEFFSREIRQPDEELLRMFAVLGSQLGQFFERKQLEEHLIQSQKMETVGKLSSGIAHEFNSILTAIIGQSELLLGDLPAQSPLIKNATEINKAAGRAATLTRQLLAYGRKQLLKPEILDLNQVITSMEGMFHHLMGDSVGTQIIPASNLHAVKADAAQIEQVIMNMAINAREAMPNGGKLTLETANVSFDQESVVRYPELKAGDYVMLAITDTGTGMSEKVKARIFEPFFSTKDVGQGTGLGLSTCYGIVKQSGGHISVYSEPARGASFKIYLPQVEQQTKIPTPRLDSSNLPRGTETILLVEDDPALLEMAATLLRRLGYKVLAAGNGIEALSVKHQRDVGHIDLLFTDVVMPHMSGKELADRVRALYPHTRILFTSAYTENAIVHQGVLDKGVALLQKPFTPAALAHKIREVLDVENILAKPGSTASLKVDRDSPNCVEGTITL